MRAVGSPELIRDMRRGYITSVERFRTLCEVLDLEFYAGRRREEVPVDEDRLAVALETAEKGLEGGGGRFGTCREGPACHRGLCAPCPRRALVERGADPGVDPGGTRGW